MDMAGIIRISPRRKAHRRPPSTLLFESADLKLGDESEPFRDLDE
jgi:hypothetical protein